MTALCPDPRPCCAMVYVAIAPQNAQNMQFASQCVENFAPPPGQMIWFAPFQHNDFVQPLPQAFTYHSAFSQGFGEEAEPSSPNSFEHPAPASYLQQSFAGQPPIQLFMERQTQEQPHNLQESFAGQPPIQCFMPQDVHYEMGAETPHYEMGVESPHYEMGVETTHYEMGVETTHYEMGEETPQSFDEGIIQSVDGVTRFMSEDQAMEHWEIPVDGVTTFTSENQAADQWDIEGQEEVTPEGGDAKFELSKSTLRRRRRQRAAMKSPLAAETGAFEQDSILGMPAEERATELLELLRAGGETQRSTVSRFRRLAFESQGSSRVAQIALEEASATEAVVLLRALRGNVREAMKSMFANYVVQRAVEFLPNAATNFIPQELLGAGIEVARHRFGCRIFCRLLEHGSLDDDFTNALLEEVLAEADALSRHTYGNFVIRHCLEFGHPWHRHCVAAALCANLVETARDQNGSRVVESALEFCDDADKQSIAGTLLADPDQLISLATEPLGRHVVKALLRTPGEWQQPVASTLRPAIRSLRESKQGRPVLQALGALEGTKDCGDATIGKGKAKGKKA